MIGIVVGGNKIAGVSGVVDRVGTLVEVICNAESAPGVCKQPLRAIDTVTARPIHSPRTAKRIGLPVGIEIDGFIGVL